MLQQRWRLSPGRLLLAAALPCFLVAQALAQEEFAPPEGKGKLVVLLSGHAGPKHDKDFAKDVAALGYDVVLYDGNALQGQTSGALQSMIAQAKQMPHVLPGKVGLVGVSLGGGFALGWGAKMPDAIAVDVVWYPVTRFYLRNPEFTSHIQVPVLMFAGESDNYHDCCLITTARSLAAGAATARAPFELVTYPGVDHDFIRGGTGYNETAYRDALAKTDAKLKAALAD